MLGTYVNTIVIIIGSIIGLLVKKGLKEKYKVTVMHGVALSVLFIGISTALEGLFNGGEPILFIISLVAGGILGEFLDLDLKLIKLGEWLQSKAGKKKHNIADGFIAASLLFCIGTMAILGSIESGLKGDHDTLFAKSVLDGVTSIFLASSLGVGVLFSSISVLLYQGSITLLASLIEPVLTQDIIREISIIGGILIFSLGLNMLNITKIKSANLLPAIFIPPIYYLFIEPIFL